MKETHVFLVPDYYPRFRCKMGACRSACCEGWSVTVSLKDYYRLLGEDCGKSLRKRLDISLHVLEHPTEEEYAEISHDYNGNCRLRMEDGRCALQAELGEDALSPVCRLYPRGVRSEGDYECSCACSCEATLELLLREEPLRFIQHELPLEMPKSAGRTIYFETVGREQEIRLYFISLMQDRRFPLWQRLLNLSEAIEDAQRALEEKDGGAVEELLRRAYEPSEEHLRQNPTEESLSFGLRVAENLVERMDGRSPGLRRYGEEALRAFSDDPMPRYRAARAHFEMILPQWESFFENMLVNHMFFGRFPFQDRPDSLSQEKTALDAVYALLRFLGLGCMANRERQEDFVDVCAAAFRLIDHSAFDRYAGRLLTHLGCGSAEEQKSLLTL